MISIPQFILTLCWDTNPKDLDLNQHSKYIIERVLEYGDRQEAQWIFSTYQVSMIAEVLKSSKRLSARSANFYAKLLKIPEKEVLCLRKPYTEKQHRF